jgi:hypothetical protein
VGAVAKISLAPLTVVTVWPASKRWHNLGMTADDEKNENGHTPSGFLPKTFQDQIAAAMSSSRAVHSNLNLIRGIERSVKDLPSIPISPLNTSAIRTAAHTQQMAEYTEEMSHHIAQLAELTRESLQLSADSRAESIRSDAFSRRMSIASLWIAIASLGAALGSIVVAVVALAG